MINKRPIREVEDLVSSCRQQLFPCSTGAEYIRDLARYSFTENHSGTVITLTVVAVQKFRNQNYGHY